MRHDWIIDVLTDLTAFARANALDALAEQLDEAQLVAQVEISVSAQGGGLELCGEHTGDGRASGAS